MLSLLLGTQTAKDSEEPYDDENIIDEFTTFFIAGMDTTGHLVTMALYHLLQHPQCLEKLRKEVAEVYDSKSIVDPESISKMDYMQAVLKETLRMTPPAVGPFARLCIKEHTLGDLHIKKNVSVRPNPLYNHYHPDYFKNPHEFNPDRWLNENKNVDPFVFLPFSAGPRNCIGQHMSMMESKIIMGEFLRRFDFENSKADYQLKMTQRFLSEPFETLKFNLTRRK